jgi:hypothetical protein
MLLDKVLEERLYTSPEEQDPRKPFIAEGERIRSNPKFDMELVRQDSIAEELERREKYLGTSFFLNFDPLCEVHQLQGSIGESVREDIRNQLIWRFCDVFKAQFPDDDPPPKRLLANALRTDIEPRPQPRMNNGEVYLWMQGYRFTEEFTVKMLLGLKANLEKSPVCVTIEGQKYDVPFYGWGFRYI